MHRRVGTWNQFPVYSEEEIINVIKMHLGFRNIGISVCAYRENEQILLFLPFDFDSDNIYEPWDDADKLFECLVDMDVTCRVNFSGKKGFHVIAETEPKPYPTKQIWATQQFFRDVLGLETMDEKVHDISRLIRIPWTYNIKGTWCRTIAGHDGHPLDLDDLPVEFESYERHETYEYGNVEYKRPCVEWLINNKEYWMKKRGKYEPTEEIRLTWAAIRLWRGDSIDEIIEEAKTYGWNDFDEDIIQKKLEYLDSREWNPHSCDSLKALGYCTDKVYCKKRNNIHESMRELGII